MLDIQGNQAMRSGARLGRRDFLRVGALSLGGLTLADWLGMQALGGLKPAKAKSIIQIWAGGGPSHLDTFDPKPEAGADYCGPLKSPIATNVPGIRISELLPVMAKQADKYSIIRGFTHQDFGHETAAYTVTTGHLPTGDLVYPSFGCVVSLKKGYDAGYQGNLPPYITLANPVGWYSETGFLGQKYKTFATGGDPNAAGFTVNDITPPGAVPEKRLQGRRTLLQSIDSLAREMDNESIFQTADSLDAKAYGMILGDAKKAFDLSGEKNALRDRYGRTFFGQSCLMARRLVQNGVPFVTIHHEGWDTHYDNFAGIKNLVPPLDKGLGTLLEDLAQTGLLSSTIVVWYGEFGRTPKIDWSPQWMGGRHHYPLVYSVVVAGGGFRGGTLVGSSDDKGELPKDRPVRPWDLTASMYKLLGIEPNERLPHPQGCVAYVTPLASGKVPSGGLLTEIM